MAIPGELALALRSMTPGGTVRWLSGEGYSWGTWPYQCGRDERRAHRHAP